MVLRLGLNHHQILEGGPEKSGKYALETFRSSEVVDLWWLTLHKQIHALRGDYFTTAALSQG